MKKIIMVLIAVAVFASVHAQSSRDEARRNILGQPKRTTTAQQSRNVILGRNHGKHLGWYKGVGNPHRYDVQPGRGKKWEDHDKGHGHGKHD
jgi:Ni/Co efflux regulator RcnB